MHMNRKALPLIIAAAVLIVGGGIAYGVSRNSSNSSTSTGSMDSMDSSSMSSMDHSDTSSAASDAQSTNKVMIQNFSFKPKDIKVKVGTTVTWTNNDGVQHNVVSDNGGDGPNGPLLAKGASYSYTFKKTGTFDYHCNPHPDMKASVIVTN
jgi:amicyanin